jgi:hypothetical protein
LAASLRIAVKTAKLRALVWPMCTPYLCIVPTVIVDCNPPIT